VPKELTDRSGPAAKTQDTTNQPPPNPDTDNIQQMVAGVVAGSISAPVIYCNGFALGMSNADAFLVLQLFGKPVGIVTLSYTLTKTLAEKLAGLVEDWERKTGQRLQTTDSIDKALLKGNK